MVEGKKSFVLYADLIHTVKKMKDAHAGILLKTILSYVNDENPVVDNQIVDLVFEPIKLQMKRDLQKYETKKQQWSEAGKASAEARRKSNEKATDSTDVENRSTDSTVTDTVNVTVNVNDTTSFKKEAKENSLNVEANILELETPPEEKLDDNPPPPITAKGKTPKAELNFDFCENSPLKEILIRWLDYKKWKGQRYKGQDSVETMFKTLVRYSANDPTIATEIIEDAIAKNYSGFFKPTQNLQNGNYQSAATSNGSTKPKTNGGVTESATNEFFGITS